MNILESIACCNCEHWKRKKEADGNTPTDFGKCSGLRNDSDIFFEVDGFIDEIETKANFFCANFNFEPIR